MKIVIAEASGYSNKAIAVYRAIGEVVLANSLNDVLKELPDAHVLVVKLQYVWTPEILAKAKLLKLIVSSTTGLNHIRLPINSSIRIVSLKGEMDFLSTVTPTAELAWGLILSLSRNIPAAIRDVEAGRWNRNGFIGRELYGAHIGIIGYGRLGKMVASYALAFGMRVQVYDNDPRALVNLDSRIASVELEELMETSDVVTLHVPLIAKNSNLLSKDLISKMQATTLFVNTSRGELVDEIYLLEMLEMGKLGGIGLDVLSDEVLGDEGWARKNRLIQSPNLGRNLLITPHIGGACTAAMQRTELFVAHKVNMLVEKGDLC